MALCIEVSDLSPHINFIGLWVFNWQLDHCIDALRQMLQCVVDITPIPTRYYPGIGHNYIDSDREHTCRDFDQMRVWMSHRTAITIQQ